MCVCWGWGCVSSSQSLMQSSTVLVRPPPPPSPSLHNWWRDLYSYSRQHAFLRCLVRVCSLRFSNWLYTVVQQQSGKLPHAHSHSHAHAPHTHDGGTRRWEGGGYWSGGGGGGKKKKSEKVRKQSTTTRTLVLYESCPSSP